MTLPRPVVAMLALTASMALLAILAFALDRGDVVAIVLVALLAVTAVIALVTAGPAVLVAVWRRWARDRHQLEFYELVLSTHDESRLGDIADMMEMVIGQARTTPARYLGFGQPPVIVQTQCMIGASDQPEVYLQIGCMPRLAALLEAALHVAYPDVRLGWREAGQARQATVPLSFEPRAVTRWRKSRSFIHPVMPHDPDTSTPPLRAVIAAQVAAAEPTVLRFTIVPAREMTERFARRRYHRHENQLDRASVWGLREAGLRGKLASRELTTASLALDHALAHCLIEVASTSETAAEAVGSALRAHRGPNRLYAETLIRRRAALRRFTEHRTPILLDVTFRRLLSAQELAFLLALPGAEAKDAPLRRLRRPRLPATPGALTAPAGGEQWSTADTIDMPMEDRC